MSTILNMKTGRENLVLLAVRKRLVELCKVQLSLARLNQEVVEC
jgi:hypothetical protein